MTTDESAKPRIWDDLLSEQDRLVYRNAGYGGRVTPGNRPALLVIDVTYDFVGDRPEPILDSIKKFPNSCGESGWRSMAVIKGMLAEAHTLEIPVFYTHGPLVRTPLSRGAWGWKKNADMERPEPSRRIGNDFPELVAPTEGDTVIEKTKPSGFFGTPLLSYLVALGVDTLVVTGSTTSGCIRATVLDGFSNNFRTLVVQDGVFDRGETPHKANLFDMHQKYAHVLESDEAITYMRSVRAQPSLDQRAAGHLGVG